MLILASASPRRHDLLARLGLAFRVAAPDVDERGLSPLEAARAKAAAALPSAAAGEVVVACDTVVAYGGERFGKPPDRPAAAALLSRLAGREVTIESGLVAARRDGRRVERVVANRCRLAPFDAAALAEYLDSGVWADKAAGLAVQHGAPSLVAHCSGCFANAVGLPVCELAAALTELGVDASSAPPCRAARPGPCRFAEPWPPATAPGGLVRRRALVRGRVQGVFYRESCRAEAARLGVSGWVRNRPDGRVEAELEGPPPAVAALLAWLGEGPPRAVVTGLDVEELTPTGASGFTVRRSPG